MAATDTTTWVPGYVAGTWDIDLSHSDVAFSVRHLMVSKVRGHFTKFEGTIVTGEQPFDSSVHAVVDLSSVDTNDENRDAHLRSVDLFDVDQHPTLEFQSTGVRPSGHDFVLDGDLAIHGVTRPVSLKLELNGFLPTSPFGDTRAGFSASTEISRGDFGIDFNMPLDGGGVVIGDKVQIALEVEAVLRKQS
jgi:polyisoprenoid-binding protein YceI